MDIKIIGSHCKNGMQLCKMVTRAIDEVNPEIELTKLDDKKSIEQYGVTNIPGLVIEDKLISQGKVLSQREISKLIQV